ncbi:MAG: hypothetical protein AUG50_02340 [Betaproteobacteria bacterium 13_1_20CM_3_63_8]|nr:MAG: hypothetical protein AUG50_02340 [Betaproteobacteria bacterium 13_1_20CM_3_63_8]
MIAHNALLVVLCVLWSAASVAASVVDPLNRDALKVSSVGRSVLLSAATAGPRVVAVGERGTVALSDDGGRTWRQATRVPVSITLTAVRFVNDKQGWAVGHGGVVLHTEDAGETWSRQLDGITLAQLAVRDAQANVERLGPGNAEAQRMLRDAQLLVDDGPDKPFLDLEFDDDQHGIVVGAYNLIYATSDGGKSWQSWMGRTDNPKALHLYALRHKGDTIFIAGEQGLLLHSVDAGRSFTRVSTPYQGSWFSLALQTDGSIVLAGLRGNVYRFGDNGQTWTQLTSPVPVSFVSATFVGGTGVVLANQAGQLFSATNGENALRPLPAPPVPALTGLVSLVDGGWLALTVQGAIRILLPSPTKDQAPAAVGGAK